MNIRHLGLLRYLLREEADVQQVLLEEIISRTLKTLARDKLRKFRATSTNDTILDYSVCFLNQLWGAQRDSRDFWCNEVLPLVIRKYGKQALHLTECANLLKVCRPYLCQIVELTAEATPFQLTVDCKQAAAGGTPRRGWRSRCDSDLFRAITFANEG